jgi:cell shape-determining protein MreC
MTDVLNLRFNQIFLALMALSFASAFFVPPQITNAGRQRLQGLYIPVSHPAYELANWIRRKWVVEPAEDNRASDDIDQENVDLRQEVTRLQMQIERLEGLAAERQALGDLKSLCDRLTVDGTDSGMREGLIVTGPALASLQTDQTVLYSGGLAGKIDQAGSGAAHVRLLTDPGFTISGRFVRFVKSDAGMQAVRLSQALPIIQGAGNGEMIIGNLSFADVANAKLQADDWVVLSDNAFPSPVQGVRIGRIASIGHLKQAPWFAEIRLQPESGLQHLSDVWVLTHMQ